MNTNVQKAIIRDVLKRPLDNLMPVYDLNDFLLADSYDAPVSLDKEVRTHLSSDWEVVQKQLQLPKITERVIKDFEEFEDDIVEKLNFNSSTITPIIDTAIDPLRMPKLDSEVFKGNKFVGESSPSAQVSRESSLSSQVEQEPKINTRLGPSWGAIKRVLNSNDQSFDTSSQSEEVSQIQGSVVKTSMGKVKRQSPIFEDAVSSFDNSPNTGVQADVGAGVSVAPVTPVEELEQAPPIEEPIVQPPPFSEPVVQRQVAKPIVQPSPIVESAVPPPIAERIVPKGPKVMEIILTKTAEESAEPSEMSIDLSEKLSGPLFVLSDAEVDIERDQTQEQQQELEKQPEKEPIINEKHLPSKTKTQQPVQKPENKRPGDPISNEPKKSKPSLFVENFGKDLDPIREFKEGDIPLQYLYNAELFVLRNKSTGHLKSVEISDLKSIEKGCSNIIKSLMPKLEMLKKNSKIAIENVRKGVLVCHTCYHIISSKQYNKVVAIEGIINAIVQFTVALLRITISLPNISDNNKYPSLLVSDLRSWLIDLLKICSALTRHSIFTESNISSLIIVLLQASSPKSNIDSKSPLKPVVVASADCLVTIYKQYPVERKFILSEIMTSMNSLKVSKDDKLITTKNKPIHVFSHIIFSLTQTVVFQDFKEEYQRCNNNMTTLEDKLYNEAKSLDVTIYEIISKITDLYLNGERDALEIIVEDLINVLTLLQYSSGISLTAVLIKVLTTAYSKPNIPQPIETGLIGLCGNICLTIHELHSKIKGGNFIRLELDSLKREHIETLRGLRGIVWSLNGYMFKQAKGNNVSESSRLHMVLRVISLLLGTREEIQKSFEIQKSIEIQNSDEVQKSSEDVTEPDSAKIAAICSVIKLIVGNLVRQLLDKNTISLDECPNPTFLYKQLIISHLSEKLGPLIHVIVDGLKSSRIKTRSKCINLISGLIVFNPQLLISPQVYPHISQMIFDESPMVRDSILDLLNTFMAARPELVDKFYVSISNCLDDRSIQVRKRALSMLQDMYFITESNTVRCNITSRILTKMEDEDVSIVKSASSIIKKIMNDSKFIEVCPIVFSSPRYSETFDKFLGAIIGEDPLFRAKLSSLVAGLISKVISSPRTEIESYLSAISTIIKRDGTLFPQKYLRPFNYLITGKDGSYQALKIIRYAIPHCQLSGNYIDDIFSIITTYIGSYQLRAVSEALYCCSELCKIQNNYIKLGNITTSFLGMIYPYVIEIQNHQYSDSPKLIKLLNMIGLFGSICDLESVRNMFVQFGLRPKETVVSLLLGTVVRFCDSNFNDKTRSNAIKNMLSICSSNPKLFSSQVILDILDREFKGGSIEVKQTIVREIYEFLQKVEDNVDSSQKKIGFNDNESYFEVDACAAIVQRYIHQVMEFVLYDEGDFGITIIHYLATVVKLGYVNPTIILPTIIGLEASDNEQINFMALASHRFIFDRYQSLCDSSYIEGFKIAVFYRYNVSSKFFETNNFLQTVYSVINSSYTSRKKFATAISKMLRVEISDKLSFEEAVLERDSVVFASINLANMELLSLEEVLIFIFAINKILRRQGLDLYDLINDDDHIEYQKRLMCTNCNALGALINLKKFLIKKYNVTEDQIEGFRPDKVDLDLRKGCKIDNEVRYYFDESGLIEKNTSLVKINEILGDFVSTIQDYS